MQIPILSTKQRASVPDQSQWFGVDDQTTQTIRLGVSNTTQLMEGQELGDKIVGVLKTIYDPEIPGYLRARADL